MASEFHLDSYDFTVPAAQIAQNPAARRDHSRLLHLPRTGEMAHLRFDALPTLLRQGDLLVTNETQVIPARLPLRRQTGGRAEVLLCQPLDGDVRTAKKWTALGRPASALAPGQVLRAADGSLVEILSRTGRELVVRTEEAALRLLEREGEVPLPPYIHRDKNSVSARGVEDKMRYQSIFAKVPGAVAAPTASLHFTEDTLAELATRGIERSDVILHVGPGTFLPVAESHAADVRAHPMHPEWYRVPDATQAAIARARARGGRVVAVGTTALRALETWGLSGAPEGQSELYILPGYRFGVVDGLVTNFHLPRSTLLFLVSAMVGRERLLETYKEAIAQQYRFFSYGDAMVIL